jgi:hypothetical protein
MLAGSVLPGIRLRHGRLTSTVRIAGSVVSAVGKKARVRELAAQMADHHLRRTGIAKAAGAVQRDQLLAFYTPIAKGVAVLEKCARILAERARRQDEAAEMIAHQVRVLQALNAGPRGVSEIQQGLVDLDLQRFGVGLVDRQQAPKTMNGHSKGEGVGPAAPPPWHPESDL